MKLKVIVFFLNLPWLEWQSPSTFISAGPLSQVSDLIMLGTIKELKAGQKVKVLEVMIIEIISEDSFIVKDNSGNMILKTSDQVHKDCLKEYFEKKSRVKIIKPQLKDQGESQIISIMH